jgi:dTDP-4-dehydrorhamnose reductase
LPASARDAVLVVGVDSLIGGAVALCYRAAGARVFGTTRRLDSVGEERLYLDLVDAQRFICPPEVGTALIAGALMPYSRCDTDPSAAQINVIGPAQLAAKLCAQGVFCVFISSNTVFGGERPFCNEDDPVSPQFPYARQKADAERALSEASHEHPLHYCVARLTKVLAPSVPPLPDWHHGLSAGETIHPFGDLTFAPMSRQFVAASLRRIADARMPGRFHLSGQDDVSYSDFAGRLVAAMGLPGERVQPTTAAAAGIKPAFQPRFSALGMARTQGQLGIGPQSLAAVISDLLIRA